MIRASNRAALLTLTKAPKINVHPMLEILVPKYYIMRDECTLLLNSLTHSFSLSLISGKGLSINLQKMSNFGSKIETDIPSQDIYEFIFHSNIFFFGMFMG